MSSSDGGCGVTFACQAAGDTCASAADCTASDAGGPVCSYVTDHHECAPLRICGTGRPFLVGGAARVAALSSTASWASSLAPEPGELDAEARAAALAHWTHVALMEHASIAAFARFTLDLMSLGAPPSLVLASQQAIADETAHAQDAFALASAYAGRAVGPGALDLAGALERRSPLEIVHTTILEGCIGETVAAVEAAEGLAHATDGAVRKALARVQEDETRHAELAWRFLQWVLEEGPEHLRGATVHELARVVRCEVEHGGQPDDASPEGDGDAVPGHGVLGAATRRELRRRVLRDVIAPCADALIGAYRMRAAPSHAPLEAVA
jgi:hypothetical protein